MELLLLAVLVLAGGLAVLIAGVAMRVVRRWDEAVGLLFLGMLATLTLSLILSR